MSKPKLRILVVDRPLKTGEQAVKDIFKPYKENYDVVIFPLKEGKNRTEVIVLNTKLMDAYQWADLFCVSCDCEEEDPFYDFDLPNVDEQTTYDILAQKFEVATTNLTAVELN